MKSFLIIILTVGIFIWNYPADAKIYKWVDEQGKVHFTNDSTQVPQDEGAKIKTFRDLPSLPARNINTKNPSNEKQTVHPRDDMEPEKPGHSDESKETRDKDSKPERSLDELGSNKKLLAETRKLRQEQFNKIVQFEEMYEDPNYPTSNNSLDQTVKNLKQKLKILDKKIIKYKQKIKALSDE